MKVQYSLVSVKVPLSSDQLSVKQHHCDVLPEWLLVMYVFLLLNQVLGV